MTSTTNKLAFNGDQPALPSIARRLAALIYDLLLVLAILLLGTFPWVIARGSDGNSINYDSLGIAYQLYCALLIFGYFVLSWHLKGATLGMKSWRLRLVSDEGATLALPQLLIRASAAPFAWVPLALGVVWQHVDARGRTWHDIVSTTRIVVIKKSAA